MKKHYIFILLMLFVANGLMAQTTYYWVGGASAAWNISTSWNTTLGGGGSARTTPNTGDILIFDGSNIGGVAGSAVTVTAVPYETNAQLSIQNNGLNVTLSTSPATSGAGTLTRAATAGTGTGSSFNSFFQVGDFLFTGTNSNFSEISAIASATALTTVETGTISSLAFSRAAQLRLTAASNALSVASGCTLTLGSSAPLVIRLTAGATTTISGAIVANTAAQRLISTDAAGITFLNGSSCSASGSASGSIFGSKAAVSNDNVIFASGSTYIAIAGSNPFGAGQPSSVVVFQTASLFKVAGASQTPAFSGRTYADVEFAGSGISTLSGGFAVMMNNLTVTSGTVNINMTAAPGHSIKGNITVANGATLNFNPASAGTMNFNGTTAQTITNAGTLTFAANEAVVIANPAGVTFNNAQIISGTTTVNSGAFLATAAVLTLTGSPAINGAFQLNQGGSEIGGIMTYGPSSTLIYAGTSLQTTSDTEFPTSNGPNGLTINNAAGVALHASRSIAGNLLLNSGKLTLGANDLTLASASPAAITAYSAGSYIVTDAAGALIRAVSAAGTYAFPVGISTDLQECSVNFAAPLGAANTLAARFINAPGGSNGLPLTESPDNIDVTSDFGYWEVKAGTAFLDTYTGSFIAKNFSDITDYTKLHLVKRPDAASPWILDGAHVATTGSNVIASLQRTGMSGFSQFGVGQPNSSILPVKLGNVKAYQQGNGIKVDWSNLTESQVANYKVERSANGQAFTQLSTVSPKLNNGTKADYTFFDASPMEGVNFYRIQSLDLDGKKLYSVILKVNTKTGKTDITIYPNPITGNLVTFLASSLPKGQYTVSVINAGGQQVFSKQLSHNGGGFTEAIQLPASIKTGMYNLQLTGSDVKLAKAFIIQ